MLLFASQTQTYTYTLTGTRSYTVALPVGNSGDGAHSYRGARSACGPELQTRFRAIRSREHATGGRGWRTQPIQRTTNIRRDIPAAAQRR